MGRLCRREDGRVSVSCCSPALRKKLEYLSGSYTITAEDLGETLSLLPFKLVFKPEPEEYVITQEEIGRQIHRVPVIGRHLILEPLKEWQSRRAQELERIQLERKRSRISSGFTSGWLMILVMNVLERYPDARDNDEVLCAVIWEHEMDLSSERISWETFSPLYQSGQLANAEAIVRARRIVQDRNPALRGFCYEKRQKHAARVREELASNNGSPEDLNIDMEAKSGGSWADSGEHKQ